MQCTSYYRDPFETAAWQLYLKECSFRAAREEVAFLEAVGGATAEELSRIRQRVMAADAPMDCDDANNTMAMNHERLLNMLGHNQVKNDYNEDDLQDNYHRQNERRDSNNVTVSLKSVLNDILHSEAAINSLCRRVRPMLEQHGIPTFKKHQAVHVLRVDAQRVRELGAGLV